MDFSSLQAATMIETFGWRDTGISHAVGDTGRMMILYLVGVVKISDVGSKPYIS